MDNDEDNNDDEEAGDYVDFIETRDEEIDSDKVHNYEEKVKEIQQVYLPTLQSLLAKVSKEEDDQAASFHKKLQALYNMFITPKKKLTLESLLRCERLLKGLTKKIKFQTLNRKGPNSPCSGQPTRPSDEPRPSTSRNVPLEEPSTSGLSNFFSDSKVKDMNPNKWPNSTPRQRLSFEVLNPKLKDVEKIRHESFKSKKTQDVPPATSTSTNMPKSIFKKSSSHSKPPQKDTSTSSNTPKSILKKSSSHSKTPLKDTLAKSCNPSGYQTKEKATHTTAENIKTDNNVSKKPKHKPIIFDKEEVNRSHKSKKTTKHTPITFNVNDNEYNTQGTKRVSRFDSVDPSRTDYHQPSRGNDRTFDEEEVNPSRESKKTTKHTPITFNVVVNESNAQGPQRVVRVDNVDSSQPESNQPSQGNNRRRVSWSGGHSSNHAPSCSQPTSQQLRQFNPRTVLTRTFHNDNQSFTRTFSNPLDLRMKLNQMRAQQQEQHHFVRKIQVEETYTKISTKVHDKRPSLPESYSKPFKPLELDETRKIKVQETYTKISTKVHDKRPSLSESDSKPFKPLEPDETRKNKVQETCTKISTKVHDKRSSLPESYSNPSKPPERDETRKNKVQETCTKISTKVHDKRSSLPESYSNPSKPPERDETRNIKVQETYTKSSTKVHDERSSLPESYSNPSKPPERDETRKNKVQETCTKISTKVHDKKSSLPESYSNPSKPPERDETRKIKVQETCTKISTKVHDKRSSLPESYSNPSKPPERDETRKIKVQETCTKISTKVHDKRSSLPESYSNPSKPQERDETRNIKVQETYTKSSTKVHDERSSIPESYSNPSKPPERDETRNIKVQETYTKSSTKVHDERSSLPESYSNPSKPPERDETRKIQVEETYTKSSTKVHDESSSLPESYSNPSKPPERDETVNSGVKERSPISDYEASCSAILEKYANPPKPSSLDSMLYNWEERQVNIEQSIQVQVINTSVRTSNQQLFYPDDDKMQPYASDDSKDSVCLRESEKKLNQLLQKRITHLSQKNQSNNFVSLDSQVPKFNSLQSENSTENMSNSLQSENSTENMSDFHINFQSTLDEMMRNVGKRRSHRSELILNPNNHENQEKAKTQVLTEKNSRPTHLDSCDNLKSLDDSRLLRASPENNKLKPSSQPYQNLTDSTTLKDTISDNEYKDSTTLKDKLSDNEYSDLEERDDKLLEICRNNVSKTLQAIPVVYDKVCTIKEDNSNSTCSSILTNSTSFPPSVHDLYSPSKSSDSSFVEESSPNCEEAILYDSIVKCPSVKPQFEIKPATKKVMDASSSKNNNLTEDRKEILTKPSNSIFIKSQDKPKHSLDTQRYVEESVGNKMSQSLRSKLSDQIQTIHKVGTSCGGSLRGLKQNINEEKMMPRGRIASLKPGALFDLMGDKPQRHNSKPKPKPTPQNTLPQSTKTVDALDIVSKLSESDIKKIKCITDNIGKLPTPNLLPSSCSTSFGINLDSSHSNQISSHVVSPWEINNLQTRNIPLSMTNTTSTMNNCDITKIPEPTEPFWTESPYSNDQRANANDQSREGQNYSSSLSGYSNKGIFEKPTYSSNASQPLNTNAVATRGPAIQSNYNPPGIQIDPLKSPCYDGSSNHYMNTFYPNMENQIVQQINPNSTPNTFYPNMENQIVQQINPNSTPNTFYPNMENQIIQQVNPNSTPVMYNDRNVNQNQLQMIPYSIHGDVRFQNYNQQLGPGPNYQAYGWSSTNTSYRAWQAENSQGCNERQGGRKNYQSIYGWPQKTHPNSGFNPDTSFGYSRPDLSRQEDPKPVEPLRKMKNRDPRIKSTDENLRMKEEVGVGFKGVAETSQSSSHDIRDRVRSPVIHRNRRKKYYGNSERRRNSPNFSERSSNHRKSQRDNPQSKHDNIYSSPPKKLSSDSISPKTGVNNGLQNFKIPKLKRETNEKPTNKGSVKGNCTSNLSGKGVKVSLSTLTPKKGTKESKLGKKRDDSASAEKNLSNATEFKNRKAIHGEVTTDESSPTKQYVVEEKVNKGMKLTGEIVFNEEESCVNEESLCRQSLMFNNSENKKVPLDIFSETNIHSVVNESQTTDNNDCTVLEDNFTTSQVLRDVEEKDLEKVSQGVENKVKNTSLKQEGLSSEPAFINKGSDYNPLETIMKPKSMESNIETAQISTILTSIPLDNKEDPSASTEVDLLNPYPSFKSTTSTNNNAITEGMCSNLFSGHGLKTDVLKKPGVTDIEVSNEMDCAIDLSVKSRTEENMMHNTIETSKEVLEVQINSSKSNDNNSNDVTEHKDAVRKIKGPITPQILQELLGVIISPDKLKKVTDILLTEETNISKPIDNESLLLKSRSPVEVKPCDKENTLIVSRSPVEVVLSQESVSVDCDENGLVENKQNPDNQPSSNKTLSCIRKGKNPIKRKLIRKKKKPRAKPKLVTDSKSKLTKEKKPRKMKNELDRLQDDISKYHDSEAIAAASGLRQCRLQKEKSVLPIAPLAPKISKIKPVEKSLKADSSSSENHSASESQSKLPSIPQAKKISKKKPVQKILKKEDSSSSSSSFDSDSESSGEESLLKLSEKLRTKYGPYVLDNDKFKGSNEHTLAIRDSKICCEKENKVSCCVHCKASNVNPQISIVKSNTLLTNKPSENKKNEIIESFSNSTLNSIDSVSNISSGTLSSNLETFLTVDSQFDDNKQAVGEKLASTPSFELASDQSNSGTGNKVRGDLASKNKPIRLSTNILSKYGIKKRKKTFWSLGIIKRSKSKKRPGRIFSDNMIEFDKISNNETVPKNSTSVHDCPLKPEGALNPNNLPKTDSFIIQEGCFEYSDNVIDHIKIVADISNTYKIKCDEVVASISALSNKNHDSSLVDKLCKYLTAEKESVDSEVELQSFIGRRKLSLISEKLVENQVFEKDFSSQPLGLPEVTPQSESSCCDNSDLDSEVSAFAIELFNGIGDSDGESIADDPVPGVSNSKLNVKNVPMLFANQVARCNDLLSNCASYVPNAQFYESALPVGSNCSEFTHIMKQLNAYEVRLSEQRNSCVGGLEVVCTGNCVMFSCSVKVFNKSCEFQTNLIKDLGQHVNETHHTCWWDATCRECFVYFRPDPSSHDKASIYTQSRAFCHFVRKHVRFVPMEDGKSFSSNEETTVTVQPARSFLRVRRLSGDKLSTPLSDSSVFQQETQDCTDAIPSTSAHIPVQPAASSCDLAALTLKHLLTQTESVVQPGVARTSAVLRPVALAGQGQPTGKLTFLLLPLLKKVDPAQQALFAECQRSNLKPPSTLATMKVAQFYQDMLTRDKLRHLYKCGHSSCSYTCDSVLLFNRHFDSHTTEHAQDALVPNHKEEGWKLCVYCMESFGNSTMLGKHMRKKHTFCLYQCRYCFYRAFSICNVYYHYIHEHKEQPFRVLKCLQNERRLPADQEKDFTHYVSSLRCAHEGCSLYTFIYDSFFRHMREVHGNDVLCHFCSNTFSTVKILMEHYRTTHGVGLYQCPFCIYGTNTDVSIKLHLCYKHPEVVPRAYLRVPSEAQSDDLKLEILKKITFHKDLANLSDYVIKPPSTEMERSMEVISPPLPVEDLIKLPNSLSAAKSGIKRIAGMDFSQGPSTSKILILHSNNYPPSNIQCSSNNEIMPKIVSVQGGVSGLGFSPEACSSSSLSSPKTTNSPPEISNVDLDIRPLEPILSSPAIPRLVPIQGHVTQSNKCVFTVSPATAASSTMTSPSTATSTTMTSPSSLGIVALPEPVPSSPATSPATLSAEQLTTATPPPAYVPEPYFKCGNLACDFGSCTSFKLKSHMGTCDNARLSERMMCKYCKRQFKQMNSLVEHLRLHGPPRYSCSLCEFKASVESRIITHMKTSHQASSTNITSVHIFKRDVETDLFIASPKERKAGTNEKVGVKGRSKVAETKTKFSAEEVDLMPKSALFALPLGCSLCVYRTKVRSNLIRHVRQHGTDDSVPLVDTINPVPQKSEKMFDKMMNLAVSSHKKMLGQKGEMGAVECLYKYVPDNLRYMCRMDDCCYQCLSELMLLSHIRVIHKDELYYKCPHCPDLDELIPIEKISFHLQLHDCPLFRCGYCDYYSPVKRDIVKHQDEIHYQEPVNMLVMRVSKPNEMVQQPLEAPAILPEEQGVAWFVCNLCTYRTKKKKMMQTHGKRSHQKANIYWCSACSYENSSNQLMVYHVNTYHPGEDNIKINCFYNKVYEVKKALPPPMGFIAPLWKRDVKRTKLIRGITVDERGNAPPPVATCVDADVNNLDILELRLGQFGKPDVGGLFVCPRCPTFKSKNPTDMREHLFKDLDYKPVVCKICNLAGTQRTKITKHINRTHSIEWEKISLYVSVTVNEDIEAWVTKFLSTQQELMKDLPEDTSSTNKRRRRSSLEAQDNLKLAKPSTGPSCTVTSSDIEVNQAVRSLPASGETPVESGAKHKPTNQGQTKKKKKKEMPTSKRRYGCNHCKVTTKYISSIKVHSRRVHPQLAVDFYELVDKVNVSQLQTAQPYKHVIDFDTDAFNCMYCKCTALNLEDLKIHWTATHKDSKVKFMHRKTNFNLDAYYDCCWCTKQDKIRTIDKHCRADHQDKYLLVVAATVSKYKCSECNLEFNSVDILKRHFSMDHPSKQFSYIVLTKTKAASSGSVLCQADNTRQSKQNPTYKCFSCHLVSNSYWTIVKHMSKHFETYGCTECDGVFTNIYNVRAHMGANHPQVPFRPNIVKGSDLDIENAKKNIVVVCDSGVKRRITQEEISIAEKEGKTGEQSLEMYSYGERLEAKVTSPVKETARKSTSPVKKPSKKIVLPKVPLLRKGAYKKRATPRRRRKLTNVFVNITSQGKKIKMPADKMMKLMDLSGNLCLKDVLQNT